MIANTEIICAIPNTPYKEMEASYFVSGSLVEVFISTKYSVPNTIARITCRERVSGNYCQFINCHLLRAGNDFDSFSVEEAYLGESEESYLSNKYRFAHFVLTNEFLPFFDTPWEIANSFLDTSERTLNFKSREARITSIAIKENAVLKIHVGYKQSYSKVRYEAHSSVALTIEYQVEVSRSDVFYDITSLTDFCFLFSRKIPGIVSIGSETTTLGIHYKGKKLVKNGEATIYGALLLEHEEIDDPLKDVLRQWISHYEKNLIPVGLLKDAYNVNDTQLKFLCLARSLEMFHLNNFKLAKIASDYFNNLHHFITANGLSDIALPEFLPVDRISLSHRLYDLARYVFDIIKPHRLLFGHITLLNRCKKISDSRNYYTHFSEKLENKVWKGTELDYINLQLTVFIRVLFLHQSGFSPSTINKVIRKEESFIFGI